MKVQFPVNFEVEPVEPLEDGDELTKNQAMDAADLAVFNFLAFVEESTQGHEVDSVEVHVDGFGPCRVSLADQ